MKRNTLSTHLRWSWALTAGQRLGLLLYFMLECVGIVLSLAFVYYSKEAVDSAIAGGNRLMPLIYAVVITMLSAMALRSVSGWLSERCRFRLFQQLQQHTLQRQMQALWGEAQRWQAGDIQNRLLQDAEEVSRMVAQQGLGAVLTFLRLLSSLAFLWVMDTTLALIILAITPLFLLSKMYFRRLRTLTERVKNAESKLVQVLQENIRLRLLIRAMGMLQRRLDQSADAQQHLFTLRMRQLNFSTFSQLIMRLSMNVGYLVTFIWGLLRLQQGLITFGTMTAFLQLVGRVQMPMQGLAGFGPAFLRFRVAADRLLELQHAQQEPNLRGIVLPNIEALQIEGLSFTYQEKDLLKGLTLSIRRGVPLALMGASGQGKTTLLRILLGLLHPHGGAVQLQQQDGRRQRLSAEHRVNMSYVPQGNTLFSGTVADNVRCMVPEASDKDLQMALYMACAEFAYSLPDGLETRVGEGGFGLSEGQAQRLAIARALLRNSAIYLFDEISSALDGDTTAQLMLRLQPFMQQRICLLVTHDVQLQSACAETFYLTSAHEHHT